MLLLSLYVNFLVSTVHLDVFDQITSYFGTQILLVVASRKNYVDPNSDV